MADWPYLTALRRLLDRSIETCASPVLRGQTVRYRLEREYSARVCCRRAIPSSDGLQEELARWGIQLGLATELRSLEFQYDTGDRRASGRRQGVQVPVDIAHPPRCPRGHPRRRRSGGGAAPGSVARIHGAQRGAHGVRPLVALGRRRDDILSRGSFWHVDRPLRGWISRAFWGRAVASRFGTLCGLQ